MELLKASFLRRYKRFLVDVRMENGEEETVHCANPGSMKGLLSTGCTVFLSSKSSGRLKYGLEYVTLENGVIVGVNTGRPNKVVRASLLAGKIPCLAHYSIEKPEVKVANSRLDFLLRNISDPEKKFYLEVKNVTLSRKDGVAEFPDSQTARGRKHLGLLIELKDQGFGAGLMYVVQRDDCQELRIAEDIDPGYSNVAAEAKSAGVEFFCYSAKPFSRHLGKRINLCL